MAVRVLVDHVVTMDDKHYIEVAADTADDALPTPASLKIGGIITGSRAVVVSTGEVSLYSETSSDWVPQFALQES